MKEHLGEKMITMNIDRINSLIDDIERLKAGYKLLEDIYLEVGPYESKKIPEELCYKMREFFGFDDSE